MHGAAVRTAVFALTLLLPSALLGAAAPSGGGGPMDPVLSTTGWTIGIFVVVMLLLRKLAWGPIVKALDEREEKIRASLEAADRMRAEQEQFQAEQEQILAAARKEANEIVAEGKRDAEAVKEKIVSDARKAAEETQRKAIAEIDRAKDNAVNEIHTRAVDLSVAIAEKLVGRAVSVEDQESLVQQTIEQYRKN
ncbi:MAG: F0F1 ATP synthase subunit B [Planctomycetota bacterium]